MMRIFDVDEIEAARPDLDRRLLPDERLLKAYAAERTTLLFTDRRIVTVQLHFLLTERFETTSYSYRSMRQFSLMDSDDPGGRMEIRIWLGGDGQPLHLRANDGTDLAPLHHLLAGMMQ